jgi:hypothetical protein
MTNRFASRARTLCVAALLSVPALVGCAGAPAVAQSPEAQAQAVSAPPRIERVVLERAVSADAAEAKRAIAAVRAVGPLGLEILLGHYQSEVAQLSSPAARHDARAQRLRAAIEGVARQRDAHVSRLYWYTDLEQAKRVSRNTGKPILSLRLLGNLDEELSCANSRFFRTALYPDAQVSRRLREDFVLHWSSERPAPRITIEFGDGRRLERTITGNSIHYVLDADGRPVDALPGLYAPRPFLARLEAAREAHGQSMAVDLDARREMRRAYHARARADLMAAWNEELVASGAPAAQLPAARLASGPFPSAAAAAPVAISKARVEVPMVQAVQRTVVEPLPSPANDAAWRSLIARFGADARLDASSRGLVRSKMGAVDDATFARKLGRFEAEMTEDTVRNEFTLHRVLHEWLAMSPAPETLEELNARVYASLFLTPRADPWLGLLPQDAYSGIEDEGVVVRPMR